MAEYLSSITDAILSNRTVAFIGAGCSMSAKDPDTGVQYNGLPGVGSLIEEMSRTKSYISIDMAFNEACYLFKIKEGKQNLIKFLEGYLNQDIDPSPSHRFLASLPFKMYISYNFDMLLEKALASVGKKYRTILDDYDISLLRDDEIAVIKPHGCFSKSDTIVASIDDELPFNEKFPLVDCFLKSQLASRTVLYVGFSLGDADFKSVHLHLQKHLQDIAPKSYAVFLNPSPFQSEYWENSKVNIIDKDAGHFLKDIVNNLSKEAAIELDDIEKAEWFSHPFFIHLQKIKNLPTETQLIDGFLEKLIEEVNLNTIPLKNLIDLAIDGKNKVLNKKPNFEAFSKAATEIISHLESSKTLAHAEDSLKNYKHKREQISINIGRRYSSVIKENDRILLFSQSKRVTQILSAVPVAIQKKCSLYIGECRPKSPGHSFFQDAIETIKHIKPNNKYQTTFYPDIILGHLFEARKIDKVIMGAHTIYVDESGNMKSFVNTSGSLVISKFCALYKIPLYVVAESDKEA
ncbi:MAG: hypothetical protein CSA15_07910, partial [Candidatus Delongbacteria bacterium]